MGEGIFGKLDSLVDIDNTCGFAGYSQCILSSARRKAGAESVPETRFQGNLALIEAAVAGCMWKHRRKSNIVKNAGVLYNRNLWQERWTGECTAPLWSIWDAVVYNGIYQPGHPSGGWKRLPQWCQGADPWAGSDGYTLSRRQLQSGYDWKDGIGQKEKRPVRKEMAWNVLETNEVGTGWVRALYGGLRDRGPDGGQPGNRDNRKEAAELVDYCNTEKGQPGAKRAGATAWKRLMIFKVWCLGNEMDGAWQINMPQGRRICQKKPGEAAKMMKWMDPSKADRLWHLYQ